MYIVQVDLDSPMCFKLNNGRVGKSSCVTLRLFNGNYIKKVERYF